MPTMEEYAKLSRAERLKRLERGPDDLASAVRGQSEAALARRPDPKNWAAKEVVCHLRDTEEGFMGRFEYILAMDNLKLPGINPDRWAEERQYLRNDCGEAVTAFRKRREESLAFLGKLAPEQWTRGAIHAVRGRMTFDDFVTLMAWHDENHLDQLKRALDGRA
jgi:hypothetical protein